MLLCFPCQPLPQDALFLRCRGGSDQCVIQYVLFNLHPLLRLVRPNLNLASVCDSNPHKKRPVRTLSR